MKIDPKTLFRRFIGFALSILMNCSCVFAANPTPLDKKADALAPDSTQPNKVLLAGRGGSGRGSGSRGGRYRGGGSSGYRSSAREGSRMSSGRSSGYRNYRSGSTRSTSRTSSMKRSSRTTGTRKSFSATGKRNATSSQVASKRGTSSRSFATRSGGRGSGGGRHHGGHGRHHGEHGRRGYNHHDRYWGYGHWYGGWGGWYYPWWGWCFGFGLGLGYGWYGPWWGFWDFPAYWAWYWPGFALSVFYAGLYATDRAPYVVVLGEDRANYYAVYNRAKDDNGKVIYIKTDRNGIVNPNKKTEIEITDRSNNVVVIAQNKGDLGDTLSPDAVSSKDDYSVIDPSEAPDNLEEGEKPEVTDEQIKEFQDKVKDNKNAELLKEKAEAAQNTDTSEAEKEAIKWEKESTEGKQLQTAVIAD